MGTLNIKAQLHQHQVLLGTGYGAGAGALWGLIFLAPDVLGSFSPLQLAMGRYLAYGAIAALLVLRRPIALVFTVLRQEWLTLAWLSLAGNTLYYIMVGIAVQAGGIAMTSLIIGFLPVAVTIVGSLEEGAVRLRALAPSLLLCIAGVGCIAFQTLSAHAPQGANNGLLGFFSAVGALTAWTLYAVGNARAMSRLRTISSGDWNLLMGLMTGAQAIGLIPIAAVLYPDQHSSADWLNFVLVSIGIALSASIFANALWNKMSQMLPLTMVGQMILFETLFALLYGFLWERRLPQFTEVLALTLVAASVVACLQAHRQRPAVSPSGSA